MERSGFSEDHQLFREAYRRFLEREVLPHRETWQEAGMVPREMFQRMGEQGFLMIWAPESLGGLGDWDFRFQQIMIEEDAQLGEPGFFHTLHSRLVGPYLYHVGSTEQQSRFIPRCASGEHILAVAMTEPDAGSDVAGIKTRAVREGDSWLLSGSKTYISNGIQADLIIVAAKTDHNNSRKIGLFVVEAGMEGFVRGRNLAKLGLKAQDTAELFFSNVRVPAANVLGDPAKGMHYLMQGLVEERLIAACLSLAAAQRAFAITRSYVIDRKVFGQSLAKLQNTRFKLAELRAQLDVLQVFVDHCVASHNQGNLTTTLAAEAKLLCSELEGKMVDEGVQLHGGAGFMAEYEICKLYANARVSRILAGTSEIMKELIARDCLDS